MLFINTEMQLVHWLLDQMGDELRRAGDLQPSASFRFHTCTVGGNTYSRLPSEIYRFKTFEDLVDPSEAIDPPDMSPAEVQTMISDGSANVGGVEDFIFRAIAALNLTDRVLMSKTRGLIRIRSLGLDDVHISVVMRPTILAASRSAKSG